jgi:hypothetical protein
MMRNEFLDGRRLGHYFSDNESKILSISARIAAAITFCCASYMCFRCYQARTRMFHRLMLGLSLHLISNSVWNIVGTSAVPSSNEAATNNDYVVWGANGSTELCSAQGFFIQFSQSAPFYYVALSIYAFQAVKVNFETGKYLWMEKYIHILVPIWPLATAIYLLAIEAYNPSPHLTCWIHSIPLDCGNDSGIECTRGPQNVEQLAWICAALPGILILLVPTVVMISLILHVKQRQSQIRIKYQDVAKQAALYLLGLFWTYLFR